MKLVIGFLLCIAVYLLNWVAVFVGWYESYEWVDIPMHVLGGMVAAILVMGALELVVKRVEFTSFGKNLKFLYQFIVVLSGVALIATIWELHEFVLDTVREGNVWSQLVSERAIGIHQPSVTDTMIDYVMGLSGAAVVVVILNSIYAKHLGR